MHPLWIIVIPSLLLIIGMVLNMIGLAFDQPPSSSEQDPIKRAAEERVAYRRFFDSQRSQALKRQERIGQYSWLVLITIIGSFIWLYISTVNKTTAANEISTLQTLGMEEGKGEVLSVTLKDGSNVKYVIKAPNPKTVTTTTTDGISNEKVPSWEASDFGTALSIGESPLPLGVALKISN